MAEKSTLARPYAQAIFELAQAGGDFAKWSGMLEMLEYVVTNEHVRGLIGSPKVSRQQLAGLILEICGDQFNTEGTNTVRLLVENGRVGLVPEIRELYEKQRAEAEKTLHAEVVSAFPLNKDQEQKIAAALTKRMGRDVSLDSRVDESLLGGIVIRAGDMIIDGSVTGHLNRLAGALAG